MQSGKRPAEVSMKKRKFLLGATVSGSSQEYSDLTFLTASPTNFRLA